MATVEVENGGNILSRGRLDSFDVESSTVLKKHHGVHVLTMAATLQLAYQSIGVVYGDIGTSPLYVYSSTFADGIIHHPDDIIGVFSLIIYTLTLLPLCKYVLTVLWANDNGDGGTFALYSVICRHAKVSLIPNHQAEDRELSTYKLATPSRQLKRALKIKEALEQSSPAKIGLLLLTLMGTCMVIGDAILTPSMSVISAVEGIQIIKPSINQDVVVGISVVILIILFSVQRFGTDKVGSAFAPAILLWFLFILFIGIYNLAKHDTNVLRAFYPKYIIDYFTRNKKRGWISLGGIVLCITGNEAMFADLGHFSVRSIQISFTGLIYPSLICAYGGQAAYLSKFPNDVSRAFYKSIPAPVYWPMFVVAVLAAIIASQAMISATFSILKQAMYLGCFPSIRVVHTSAKYAGQVYIPEINYFLMVACVLVTVSFKNTIMLGNAYGIAVVGDMIVTSTLLTLIMLMVWQTNLLLVAMYVLVIGSTEWIYYSAALYKFPKGGYLPLAFAAILLFTMYVWHYVHVKRYAYEVEHKVSKEHINGLFSTLTVTRVPGIGLLFSELPHGIPPIFSHFITNLPAIHSVVVFVCVKYLPVNTVPAEERFRFRRVDPKEYKMYRCVALYGYTDVRIGNVEFETELLESLKEFIQSQYMPRLREIEIRVSQTFESSQGFENKLTANSDGSGESEVDGMTELELQQDVEFLEESRKSGVVYLLGDSQVTAKSNSRLIKKIVVNYAYRFLRRNCRQGTTCLDIPRKNILRVGMDYEI